MAAIRIVSRVHVDAARRVSPRRRLRPRGASVAELAGLRVTVASASAPTPRPAAMRAHAAIPPRAWARLTAPEYRPGTWREAKATRGQRPGPHRLAGAVTQNKTRAPVAVLTASHHKDMAGQGTREALPEVCRRRLLRPGRQRMCADRVCHRAACSCGCRQCLKPMTKQSCGCVETTHSRSMPRSVSHARCLLLHDTQAFVESDHARATRRPPTPRGHGAA